MDKNSPFLSLERMTDIFEKRANEERNREGKIKREAEAELKKNEQIANWREKVEAIRTEQSNLIDELKKLNEAPDTKIISAKRTREICSRLSEIESYIHHGRVRNIPAC